MSREAFVVTVGLALMVVAILGVSVFIVSF